MVCNYKERSTKGEFTMGVRRQSGGYYHLLVIVTWSIFATSLAVDDLHCNNPVGISDTNSFPLDRIVVSSSSPGHEKEYIRFGCCQGNFGKAWCPDPTDAHPFVEIHLASPVPIGSIHMQPPTVLGPPSPFNFQIPDKFMTTFDLLFRLKGVSSLLTVAENVPAIANETVRAVDIALHPALFTDLIRIEPKRYRKSPCFRLELCEFDISALCPANFCKNGGICSGQFSCDCSSTGFFGNQCQLTKQSIPVTNFKFVTIVRETVITTSLNLTLHGQVTMDTSDLLNPALVIPAGSYIDLASPSTDPCLADLDKCTSGFTISVTVSFSQVNSGQQWVLTSGAVENNTPGIALFFQKGKITAFVGTSSQAWMVTKTFTVVANRWYELTISWSPSQGLVLLEKDHIIGSSFLAGGRIPAGSSPGPLTLGSPLKTTLAVLKVKTILTVSLFVQDANRAGLHRLDTSTTTVAPTVVTTTTVTLAPTTTTVKTAPTTQPIPTTNQASTSTPATTTTAWVPVCNSPLGMKDGSIRPGQIVASSSIAGHGTEMVRAGCCKGMEDGAWCAASSDPDPWIEVTLAQPMAISAVSFQVPERVDETVIPANYVEIVRLEYRDLSANNTSMRVFGELPVMKNATVAYLAGLNPIVVTDLVRLYVLNSTGAACTRFELIGCDPTDLCAPNYCQNNGTCIAEKSCKCEPGFYGNRCELTKLLLPQLDNLNPTTLQPLTTTTTEAATTSTIPPTTTTSTTTQPTTMKPTTTTLAIPGDCSVQDLDPQAKLAYNLTFLRLSQPNDLLVTPEGVLRVFGDPTLGKMGNTVGQVLTLDGTEDAVELECVPCVSNLLKCGTGFTLQVDVTIKRSSASIDAVHDTVQLAWDTILWPEVADFQTESENIDQDELDNSRQKRSITKNTTADVSNSQYKSAADKITYIVDSIEDPTRDMGMELFYDSSKLHVTLQANKGKWIIEEPYELKPDTKYRIQVSWEPTGSLILYVNGFLVSAATRVSLPRVNYYQSRPLLFGRERNGQQDSTIFLSELFIWMSTRVTLQQQGLIEELSTTPTTTAQPTTPGLVRDFVWTLVNVKQRVIVSHEWELVLLGGPSVDNTGVILDTNNKFIRIPNIKDSCLTDPTVCVEGLTIEVVIKLTTLEENSIIFTSGGEVPDQPGITLIYRFGQVHVVVSTKLQSWYVSLTKTVIWTNDFCKVQVSWSKMTSLKVFVNEILVGVSSTPVDHRNPTVSITDTLIIGGGKTTCVVNEIHIWLAHIDILINLNIIKGPVTTTQRPTTSTLEVTDASTTQQLQVNPSTVADGICPVGCYSPDMCFTKPTVLTSTLPTTPAASQSATTVKITTPRATTKLPPANTVKPSTARATPATTRNPTTFMPTATTATSTTTKPTTKPTTRRPTTTPKTTTTTTTTTTPPPPTTTSTTTTTTTPTTTTTTATTTTTLPPCPQAPTLVKLEPQVDINGQGQLVCFISTPLDPGMEIKFTFRVQGERRTWVKTIESPDVATTLASTAMGMDLMNKKIFCKAQARYLLPGAAWCWTKQSNFLTPSVQCPPMRSNNVVTVIEGRQEHVLEVKTTVPPAFFCKQGDAGKCSMEVITKIKEERGELRCSRREVIPQFVLGASVIGTGTDKKCGVKITQNNWKAGVSIPVKATIDGVVDRDRTRKVDVSVRIVGQITMSVQNIQCGEMPFNAIDRDKKATCGSVNDPHITTFDKIRYNNFIPGEFTMYEHKSLPYEVRAVYGRCNGNRGPTCNCGAVVKSGDDVIKFDTCNNRANQGQRRDARSQVSVQMYKNGQLTPGTVIRRLGCGQKYEVILPTGTKVVITGTKRPFMNIHIHASASDFNDVQGLCGNFNGRRDDDLEGEQGRNPNAFSMKWKQTDSSSILEGVTAMQSPAPVKYCSCYDGHNIYCRPGLDIFKCGAASGSGQDITDSLVRLARRPILRIVRNRYRRQANDNDAENVLSTSVPDDANVTTFSETAASSYCKDYLEKKAAVKACFEYLNSEAVDRSVLSCAEDLQELGDTEWATSHVDDLTEQCVDSAQREETAWNNTEEARDGEPVLPEEISSGLCLNDCGKDQGRGKCVSGICECNAGYMGESCEVTEATKPEVLPAVETCDLVTASCTDIAIDGDNFVSSPNLACSLKFAKIHSNLTLTSEEATVPAEFLGMSRVVCPLPEEAIAKGRSALVSVSNDGRAWSETFLHVVHKSSCQDCQLLDGGKDALCVFKPDACIIDGQCYAALERYEEDDCYRCDPEVSQSTWTKTSEPRCVVDLGSGEKEEDNSEPSKVEAGDKDNSDNDTIVIVLGVLCGVLALAALGAFMVICRKLSAQKKETLLPAQQKRFNISGKGLAGPELTSADILTGSAAAVRLSEAYKE